MRSAPSCAPAAATTRLVEASHEEDARIALRGGMQAASEMLAASRDSYRTLHSMAKLDPAAVGGAVQRWEEERARRWSGSRRNSTSRATSAQA